MFDPYTLGFSAVGLPAAIIALAAVCAWRRYWLLTTVSILSLAAYGIGLLESSNAWDYLIDPLLWLYALFATCVTLAKKYLFVAKRTQA
jgi:hypothetical protein